MRIETIVLHGFFAGDWLPMFTTCLAFAVRTQGN